MRSLMKHYVNVLKEQLKTTITATSATLGIAQIVCKIAFVLPVMNLLSFSLMKNQILVSVLQGHHCIKDSATLVISTSVNFVKQMDSAAHV